MVERFGHYLVGELLGRGGMGVVHRAHDTVNDRTVALKRLLTSDEEYETRFRREARIAAGLTHPHVVPVHAYGEIDGTLYLDMQLVEGVDLKRLLSDGLTPEDLLPLLKQVAEALDAAHAAGLVHRDVKPSNVLVDRSGHAFLADFGIARPMAATAITRTGQFIGSLDYIAPERLGGEVDGRADVYSLACVLFEALTGRLPFGGVEPAAKLAAHLVEPPPVPSRFDRRIGPGLDAVLARGLAKDADHRYPTASALISAAAEAVRLNGTMTVAADTAERALFVQAVIRSAAGTVTRAPGEGCPYPGLREFTEQEAGWFHGRAHVVTELVVRLAEQAVHPEPTVVVGASGAGKSSLLRAGLLPAVPDWPHVVLTPGADPVGALARAVAGVTGADPAALAHGIRAGRFGPTRRVVIVVDQFEELFTHDIADHERAAFTSALADAGPGLVVLAVRADFVDRCIALPPLRRALARAVILGPLGVDELGRAITAPAEAAGASVEPGLPARLIADLGGADYDPGALPRLAHALRETWHHRQGDTLTLAAYLSTGGIDGAVARTAEQVYAQLSPADQNTLRTTVLLMTSVQDSGAVTRRRAVLPPSPVLDRLVEARLVTADRDGAQLSHEALLSAWPRLRAWVDEDRDALVARRKLADAARRWVDAGRHAGDLPRGPRLATTLSWASGHPAPTPVERDYLDAVRRARWRSRTVRATTVAASTALVVVVAIAATVAVLARDESAQQQSRQLATESLTTRDPVRAMRDALRAQHAAPTPEARSALLTALTRTAPLTLTLQDHPFFAFAQAVAVDREGRRIAVGGDRGAFLVWDVVERRALMYVEDSGNEAVQDVAGLRFSPDGAHLAVSGGDTTVWDLGSKSAEYVVRGSPSTGRYGNAAGWSPDGTLAVAVPGGLELWRDGARVRPAFGQGAHVIDLKFRPDGKRLAVGRSDGVVELWEPTGERLAARTEHRDAQPASAGLLRLDYASGFLASSRRDGTVRLWNPDDAEPLGSLATGSGEMAVLGDGERVLVTDTGKLTAHSPVDGAVMAEYPGDVSPISALASSAGTTAATAMDKAADKTKVKVLPINMVIVWRPNPHRYDGLYGAAHRLAVDPAGAPWVADEQRVVPVRTGGPVTGTDVRFGPRGHRAVTRRPATGDEIAVTDPGGGERTVVLAAGTEVRAVAVSADLIAAIVRPKGANDFTGIRVWELAALTERTYVETPFPARDVQFSPDGRWLAGEMLGATSSWSQAWDTGSFTRQEGRVEDKGLLVVAFHGGSLVVAAGGTVKFTDPATARVTREFATGPDVNALAVAPDGRTVATASSGSTEVQLWDVETGGKLATVHGHRSTPLPQPLRLAFTADGLVSAGDEVLMVPTDTDTAVTRLCAALTAVPRADTTDTGCP
ncbi:serine/threonine-protein kinase [Actinosynnema sp. NPDC050436]|uniref:serine/threonine-protein kinase n=1 Tax=Actinosynnema sp. NPDC050436 TaxID=3155659 RepID=UPI0033D05C0F